MANNFYNDKDGRYPIRKVTVETVDTAVFDYFEKKLRPTVDTEDSSHKARVFFGGHERWEAIRKQSFRDENGTLVLPIISILRGDIERQNYMAGMTSAQKHITVSNIIHPKTSVIQNAVDARKRRGVFWQPKREPIIETLTIPFPDFCVVNYEITLWTQYTQHMNELLEKIFYNYENAGGRVDSFVMPVDYDGHKPKGDSYYFVAYPQGTITKASNDNDFTDQERIIKYVYNIQVPAYFILDPDDEALSYGEDENGQKVVYKRQSVNKIKLQEEVISLEEFEKLYG